MDFVPGDNVIAQFPFTSLSGSKRRPCLIIAKCNTPGDYLVAYISSSEYAFSLPSSVIFDNANPEFSKTKLRMSSVIRADKIATINSIIISGIVGSLPDSLLESVYNNLRALLKKQDTKNS